MTQRNYDYISIEKKWQKKWIENKIYEAKKHNKNKFFIHFAYPGVSGYLHVGHMRGFTYCDIIARYKRMTGYDVLFPAGFHASGIPSIGFAKKVERRDPATLKMLKENNLTEEQIKKLKNPIEVVRYFGKVYVEDYWKRFGFLIDYSRIMSTISEGYKKFIEWRKETKREIIILDDGSTSAKKRRGAVGDIKFGIEREEDDWLIVGSDNIFDWKLNNFIRFSLKRRPYPVIGLYRLKDSEKITQLGIVKVKNGIVEELIEKPKKVFSKTIATCIYFFPKESLRFIDQYIKEKKDLDVVGNYIQWLVKKTKVYGYLFKGVWIDIGTKESFKEAKRIFSNAN